MSYKIVLLAYYNLYESKRHFVQKLAEAMSRQGIQTTVLDGSSPKFYEELLGLYAKGLCDLTCSFNIWQPLKKGKFFWEVSGVPHWSIIVDPLYYYRYLFKTEKSIISCVDKNDENYALKNGISKIFFFPHAVEQELYTPFENPRDYDIVFIGSCYDHERLRQYWISQLPPLLCQVIDEAIEIILGDNKTSLIEGLSKAIERHSVDPNKYDFATLFYFTDNYLRGKDRYELIRSIKKATIHVIGATCWRTQSEPRAYGWSQNLAGQANVKIYPAISFSESLEIIKRSKICLNSMPFFKNGTHERIFTALACGALPITTDNLWVRENFIDGEELILYRPTHWDEVNDKVEVLLGDEKKRRDIVLKGQTKVLREHLWDVRVKNLLELLPTILK